jgi:2-oxo-4-hydroxy-4-carboxy-5-ureidoimidazoline decarboxylase
MASTAFRQVSADPGVDWLDELAASDARAVLWDCCRSARWAARLESLRPFRTRGRLFDYADQVTRRLEWIEVRQALTSFPRLGEAGSDPESEPGPGSHLQYHSHHSHRSQHVQRSHPELARAGSWARQEREVFAASGFEEESLAQAAVLGAREYEERFGFVFLICGRGRTARQTLAALSTRLNNEPQMERLVVRAELAAIARIRLAKLLARPLAP